jgi:hypothetical protein
MTTCSQSTLSVRIGVQTTVRGHVVGASVCEVVPVCHWGMVVPGFQGGIGGVVGWAIPPP